MALSLIGSPSLGGAGRLRGPRNSSAEVESAGDGRSSREALLAGGDRRFPFGFVVSWAATPQLPAISVRLTNQTTADFIISLLLENRVAMQPQRPGSGHLRRYSGLSSFSDSQMHTPVIARLVRMSFFIALDVGWSLFCQKCCWSAVSLATHLL
jgi:hypothetical protein